jgi:6-phosphogluconate dehydrogenase
MSEKADLGIVGLGVTGRNLLLNIMDHGLSVVGYDRNLDHIQALHSQAHHREIHITHDLNHLMALLKSNRTIMILEPAGEATRRMIETVLSLLSTGDLIIDGSDSDIRDTERYAKCSEEARILYLGVGISGDEHDLRYGASFMLGGSAKAYQRARDIFEIIAAKIDNRPCVAYMGPRSAGHYVKMILNRIERELMQLVMESYDLMKRGLGMNDDQLSQIYDGWNHDKLNSRLMGITADIFRCGDWHIEERLVDLALDESQHEDIEMRVLHDIRTLDANLLAGQIAISMYPLSIDKDQRLEASRILTGPNFAFLNQDPNIIHRIGDALYAAMILVFAENMAELQSASMAHGYGLDLAKVAHIWRGGSIRPALLKSIQAAYQSHPDLANVLLDPQLSEEINSCQMNLRAAVSMAVGLGIPAPGFMTALSYYDTYRSTWLPTHLIHEQQVYFYLGSENHVDEKTNSILMKSENAAK